MVNLTRSQKILVTLYKLAGGGQKQVRFEDIAVRVYKDFRSDFQLKGYPQYPDTGDIVHKPLYSELKKKGYVLSGNKYFSLTRKGVEYARSLLGVSSKLNMAKTENNKLTADQQKELERLKESTAVNLYLTGKKNDILDIDFYSYLGVTVRTDKYNFLGRLTSVEDAINATKNKSGVLYKKLRDCHRYLMNRFSENINFVKNSKGGRR